MIVSHEWLRAFVPHALSPEQIGALLSAHVATLEGVEALRADLAPFVVGQVVASERIPDTKLSFNRVDDGSGELLDVVCGAPNVEVGAKYPFARTGTTMPGGALTIERRKIRGHTSNGMLCSARELGLGDNHDGILTLATEAAPGTPLLRVLPIGDARIELDVLANRPDLLSQRGVAREVAALTGVPLEAPAELRAAPTLPKATTGERAAAADGVSVTIDDADGCPRYCAAVVRGVRVGPSPEWLIRRLEGVGARSISNVVDVTNYALHGLGQPMHAFDLARLAGASIVVRRARAGEPITTLDGVARTLDPETLVIADAERGQAVAGVIGGRDSEVTDATIDVLLEVAYFDPARARVSRRRTNVSTDASYRFERGVDRAATRELLDAGLALLTEVAGGTVTAILDVGAAPGALPAVRLRASRVARVLGAPVVPHEIERLLGSVGFEITRDAAPTEAGDATWNVRPPSWRQDVTREIDLVEEIARLVGFDAFPDELRPVRPGTTADDPLVIATRRVREALVGAGLYETRPLPFVRGDDVTHARVANPLGEDEPHLRRSVLETLARRAEDNLSRMQGDVRLFEVGSVFAPTRAGALPIETLTVGALVMGARRPPHFTEPKPPAFDLWDAKWLAELAGRAAHPGGRIGLLLADDADLWRIEVDGRTIGRVTRLALDAPVWAAPAFGVEVALGVIGSDPIAPNGSNRWDRAAPEPAAGAPPVRFSPLPTTPAVELDLALVVPDAVRAAAIEAVIRQAVGPLLESVSVFDEFRGAELAPGTRSLAWRLVLRDPARTLRDKEIDGRRQRLLAALDTELGVRVRGL
ncbi:MAG TPA: phenylalanine--tRNA ligase subunit beta, partial [Gemmatirosa sp.]